MTGMELAVFAVIAVASWRNTTVLCVVVGCIPYAVIGWHFWGRVVKALSL